MGSNIPRQKGHGAKKTMKPIEANGGRVHDTETCGMLLSQVERVGGLCVGSLICLQDHLQQLQGKLQLHLDIGIGSLSFAPPRSPS